MIRCKHPGRCAGAHQTLPDRVRSVRKRATWQAPTHAGALRLFLTLIALVAQERNPHGDLLLRMGLDRRIVLLRIKKEPPGEGERDRKFNSPLITRVPRRLQSRSLMKGHAGSKGETACSPTALTSYFGNFPSAPIVFRHLRDIYVHGLGSHSPAPGSSNVSSSP